MAMNGHEILPGKDGFSTKGLRDDPRQWLIYDEETQGAMMRGLEVMALQMVGQTLRRNKESKVRAIGYLMLNVADARIRSAEPGSKREQVIRHLALVMGWLSRRGPMDIATAEALDEIHATIYQMDHRFRSAGIRGGGKLRDMVRGD